MHGIYSTHIPVEGSDVVGPETELFIAGAFFARLQNQPLHPNRRTPWRGLLQTGLLPALTLFFSSSDSSPTASTPPRTRVFG